MRDWHSHAVRAVRDTGVAALFVLGVFASPLMAGEEIEMPISKDDLPAHVAKTFTEVFGNLYFRNPLDETYHPFPELSPDSFTVVDEQADVWIVSHEPLAGPTVFATVDKASGRVSFDRIIVSTE